MNKQVLKNYEALKLNANILDLNNLKEDELVIQIGSATCENAAGAKILVDVFKSLIKEHNDKNISLRQVGCSGHCSVEPIVTLFGGKNSPTLYCRVNEEKTRKIFHAQIRQNEECREFMLPGKNNQITDQQRDLSKTLNISNYLANYGRFDFYQKQSRIALRNLGVINPESIDEYINLGGFFALAKILTKGDPQAVIDEILLSNLRGRGGGGFPTGRKWQFATQSSEKCRYIICNGDEGDPGAFMDRSMLESDPFSIIEGLIIGGFVISAQQGFFYIRAEYPLAITRIEKALKICRQVGVLGKNILGSNFDFDIEIRLGAGAFVCGEETALINSIEGKRGQPRVRPPYPAVKGLWGKPTIINNVETLANIAAIINMGGDNFAKIGSAKSGGTKVFALAGKVKNTGLVEVTMGTSLREVIYDIGKGLVSDGKLKAVQTGGPAGGLIAADKIDILLDYESLSAVGSIMGSGGMIVLDDDDCIVDIAKFYLTFTQDESCGKCTPCREGTKRMLEILERITQGQARDGDLERLERLANLISKTSLCGLGRSAPNPVLSTLKEFVDEYKIHLSEKRCPAAKCLALLKYSINDNCVGCTMCVKVCPVNCISGVVSTKHLIDQSRCIKCDSCRQVCRFNAIEKR